MAFLEVIDLHKTYVAEAVQALRGVSLSVGEGEIVAVMGPSGCGKSTLLHILGALDQPSSGQVLIADKMISAYGPAHRYRAFMVGFIFQHHHMVSGMTLAENVAAPLVAQGIGKRERLRRAMELLETVGLGHRAHFLPSRVSGGERQRAAVARALAGTPKIILADEPTGNLDSSAGEAVFRLMLTQSREKGATVIIATHNHEIAALADKTVLMRDGQFVN